MNKNANYRKHNDHSHNSSTYHKKDGTPIRAILKEETRKEIKECENCGKIGETAIVQVDQSHLYPNYARNPVVYLYLCKECEDKA